MQPVFLSHEGMVVEILVVVVGVLLGTTSIALLGLSARVAQYKSYIIYALPFAFMFVK